MCPACLAAAAWIAAGAASAGGLGAIALRRLLGRSRANRHSVAHEQQEIE